MVALIDIFLNPQAPQDYESYYTNLLSTAGVLFGLAFTALLFVLQSGFSSFKYSRRMFLEVYASFGRSLLIGLAYLTVLPIASLHFGFHPNSYTILYLLFSSLYAKSLLDHARNNGYIKTLSTSAFVPASYGPVRQYFRYIWNLGPLAFIGISFLLASLLAYPMLISFHEKNTWTLSEKGLFYSSLLILFHSILRVTNFIPEYFNLSNLELDYSNRPTSDESDENPINYRTELHALETFLLSHGCEDLKSAKVFLDGKLQLYLDTERGNGDAWFTAIVNVHNPTNVLIRDQVCCYAVELLRLLKQSKVDINHFVISFQIAVRGECNSRNIFIRSTRAEMDEKLGGSASPVDIVSSLKTTLFDELYRNL